MSRSYLLLVLVGFAPWLGSSQETLSSDYLRDAVEIITDHWGVPHIYAESLEDLFFAQGYYAARDRAFQFEMWRRQATGTVAEVLGQSEIKRDHGTRLFQFRGDITAEMNHYHPKGEQIIRSYVAGVNEAIDWMLEDHARLPVEFQLLEMEPKHWTPEVVVSRHQGLLGNIGRELDIGRTVALIGPEKTKELNWFHPNDAQIDLDPAIDSAGLFEPILDLYRAYRRPVRFLGHGLGMESRDPYDAPWNDPFEEISSSIGSNNWVVSGEHTQSGYPIMANDPHRALSVPSLRYMAHLVAPGWNVIGGGEPVIPGISIGHNGVGAWGLTVFYTDAEDLYVYKLDSTDHGKYWYNSQWRQMEIVYDTIAVKDKGNEVVELRYSVHGPVLYIDEQRHLGYAMRCGWLEIGGSPYLASLRMNQAIDFESFREACKYSHIPGENMVWADRQGNIGWQAVGIAPIRNHSSGLVPVSGDGNMEWDGYLDIKKKPWSYNPPDGRIITANENITPRDYEHPAALGFSWADPARGDRIAEVLSSGQKMSLADMARLQTDYLSLPARNLVPLLRPLSLIDPKLIEVRSILESWDFNMNPSSIAATLFHAWQQELMHSVYLIKVPEKVRPHLRRLPYKRFFDFLMSPDGDFGTHPLEARDELLRTSLQAARKKIVDRLGSDADLWQYGQLNYKHVFLEHAMSRLAPDSLRDSLNVGPLPRGGDAFTVGNTGISLNQPSGATFKILVDTEDWDRTLATNSPGQSGDPSSPFYDNLFELWAADQYFPLFYSRKKIESVAAKRLILLPR